RNETLEAATVRQKLEQVPGVSRVVNKAQPDGRSLFEVETQRGNFVRGHFARAVVESGWDLNELRPASMSLEEVFLQLTGNDAAAKAEQPVVEVAQSSEIPGSSAERNSAATSFRQSLTSCWPCSA